MEKKRRTPQLLLSSPQKEGKGEVKLNIEGMMMIF